MSRNAKRPCASTGAVSGCRGPDSRRAITRRPREPGARDRASGAGLSDPRLNGHRGL
jgi:hypothetical protein